MSISQLNQLREAFQIPSSITIISEQAMAPPAPAEPTPPVSPNAPVSQPIHLLPQKRDIPPDPVLYKSSLGTPVYANIEFLAGNYPTNTKGVLKKYGPMKLEAVLLTVSQAKKIIKTEIQGRDGTAKEYIGKDDYAISINGIVTGKNGHWPIEDVVKLKAILDAPVTLEIASRYLQNLGIHYIVVESYTFEQKEGGYSYQTFSIQCVSDSPDNALIIPNLTTAVRFLIP